METSEALDKLISRYVWWEKPAWAYAHPTIFFANVMNLGSWNDIQLLRRNVSDEELKTVLTNAPVGYFSYRSWDYWHVKFNMLPIPPLPSRKL